jgi:hypothetical protein
MAILFIWLAGKAFQQTMLRYGQRLRIRELISFTGRFSKSAANN